MFWHDKNKIETIVAAIQIINFFNVVIYKCKSNCKHLKP